MATKHKAKDLVLDVFRDSKNFYTSNQRKFLQFWRMARAIPDNRRKKFNRFVPFLPAAIDLILPRLAGRLPVYDIVGVTEDDHEHSKTMKELSDFFMDKINFKTFILEWVKQTMIYGVAVAQIGWDLKKKSISSRPPKKAPQRQIVLLTNH